MIRNIWIGSLLLLLTLPLAAQKQNEQLRVVHSDRLALSKANNEQVMELSGKVHFWYGQTEFKSDRALIFDTQKIARLDGNVRVNNDSLALTADSLAYYRIPDELNAGGRVFINERKTGGGFSWLRSEYAIYRKGENNITAWRNVSAYDSDENASASCGYAFWDRRNGYAYMVEDPVLRTARQDTLEVRADKIEFFDAESKIVATFNVLAQTPDYSASSDFLLYFLEEDKAVFTGQPLFRSELADASARGFYLLLKDRKLTRAELVDSCRVEFAEQRGAIKTNWVQASFITLDFEQDALRGFHAEQAVDYFYSQEEDSERDYLVNHARGGILDALFGLDNKLEQMIMREGINGVYRFRERS
ncbi:MAG TPA: OstA-like protein [Candidatus Syntrophosphaera sp.]|nr:OstA-like protein [Candidatus Syntrophosphaera sp.]